MKTFCRGLACLSIPLLVLFGGCQTSPVSPSWPIPPDAKTRVINGYPLTYSEKGSGPTIVLVHGVLTDYRYWQPQMDAWSTRFHVVAVSLRHFYPERWNGKSDDFSVQQNAKDLTAFIESIGTPVYLVGWSYGGGPAYQTALAHPELVKKLVLDEGGLISGDDASANPSSINTKRSKETAVYFDAGDIEGGLSYAVDNINGPGVWGKLPEQVKTTVRDNAWTIVGIGMVAAPDIGCAEFASLKVPVLLVQGEFTTPRYKRALDEQAQCLSSARRVTIPKAGHSSARINPTFFNEAVGAFFDIP
jgi:esterase